MNVGSYNVTGNVCDNGGSYTPAPTTNAPTKPTPLRAKLQPGALTTPTTSGMTTQSSGNVSFSSPSTINLNPGVYNGGININSGVTTVNLASGVYYINGEFNVNTGVTINGTGVTIYMASGALTMNRAATVNLTAPTSGDTAGLVIWQDPGDTSPMILDSGPAVRVGEAESTFPAGRLR